MKLSAKGRYAVTAIVDLARQDGGAGPTSLADIALRQDISLAYLEQLFAKLRRANIVEAVRGPGGGYRLTRPVSELPVADIISAVDEPIQTTACSASSDGCTAAGGRCLTHDLWDELGRQIHLFLNGITIEDVMQRRVLGRAQPTSWIGDAGNRMPH